VTGRNRRQSHANETPRARRIREAEAREHALRARGIDPYARARAELEAGPPAVRVRGPRRLRRRLLTALIIVLVVVIMWRGPKTLPLLGRILLLAALFRTLDALRAFDIMYVLTGGGPANTTETLTVYAYRSLFQMLQLGFGSAVGVVVFALVMLVAWAYLRLLRAGEAAA